MNYGVEHIIVKEDIDHIRSRVSMYLTDTSNIGIQQGLKEIITNSVDEALNGFGKKITVTFLPDHTVRVRDYGRGVPVGLHPTEKVTGIDLCFAKLKAGGKYSDKTYNSSGGMYGVGATATNAISEFFKVKVFTNKKIHEVIFKEGLRHSPLENSKTNILGSCSEEETGTEVTFKPDFGVMKSATGFDMEITSSYLNQLAYLNTGIMFELVDERDTNNITTKSFYSENGLLDYIKELMTDKKELAMPFEMFNLTLTDTDSADVIMQYADENNSNVLLYVNRNSIPNGGTAVTGLKMGIARAVNEMGLVLNLMKEKDKPFNSKEIEEGLNCIINMTMKEPEVEGQTKNELRSTSIQGPMSQKISEILKETFELKPDILKRLIERLFLRRKANEASKRAANTIMEKRSARFHTPAKLNSCISKNPVECELFLVEGGSSSGQIPESRDVNTQAYYELRGKVLNVERKNDLKDILNNNEFRDLNSIIGTNIGEDFNIEKLKYHKIIILADADPRYV